MNMLFIRRYRFIKKNLFKYSVSKMCCKVEFFSYFFNRKSAFSITECTKEYIIFKAITTEMYGY